MKFLFVLLFMLFAGPAFGAVAIDTASSASTGATDGSTSLCWNHTTAAGSNRLMEVAVSMVCHNSSEGFCASGLTTDELLSVTYNAVSATRKIHLISGNATYVGVDVWELAAPAPGTHQVCVYSSQAINMNGGAITFTGANQGTPSGANVDYDGYSDTPSVDVTSAADEIVFAAYASWFGSGTSGYLACAAGTGETEQWDLTTSTTLGINSDSLGCAFTEAGAATVTIQPTMTYDVAAEYEVMTGFSIKAATGAPTLVRHKPILIQ